MRKSTFGITMIALTATLFIPSTIIAMHPTDSWTPEPFVNQKLAGKVTATSLSPLIARLAVDGLTTQEANQIVNQATATLKASKDKLAALYSISKELQPISYALTEKNLVALNGFIQTVKTTLDQQKSAFVKNRQYDPVLSALDSLVMLNEYISDKSWNAYGSVLKDVHYQVRNEVYNSQLPVWEKVRVMKKSMAAMMLFENGNGADWVDGRYMVKELLLGVAKTTRVQGKPTDKLNQLVVAFYGSRDDKHLLPGIADTTLLYGGKPAFADASVAEALDKLYNPVIADLGKFERKDLLYAIEQLYRLDGTYKELYGSFKTNLREQLMQKFEAIKPNLTPDEKSRFSGLEDRLQGRGDSQYQGK